jgi:hypothetical protein
MVGHTGQVVMPQIGEDDRFQAKLPGIFIGGKKVFLYGHIHAQVFVYGAVYRSHPPLAQDFDYPVSFMEYGIKFEARTHRLMIISEAKLKRTFCKVIAMYQEAFAASCPGFEGISSGRSPYSRWFPWFPSTGLKIDGTIVNIVHSTDETRT